MEKVTLKAARIIAGLKQREAAEQLNKLCKNRIVTNCVLSNWERGITYPDVRDIPAIEQVYGRKYDDIIFLHK